MTQTPSNGKGRPVMVLLPELTGEQALFMLGFLDRVIAALWQTYGDQLRPCLCDGQQLAPRIDLDDEDHAFYEGLF